VASMMELSVAEARMLTLDAIGLRTKAKSVTEVVDRLGLLQIDSVNVFERAHYLPLFSRMGKFDKDELHVLQDFDSHGSHPQLIEAWAHEASLIKAVDLPLYSWRHEYWRTRARVSDWMDSHTELLTWIKNEIRTRGPLTVSQLEHDNAAVRTRKGSWWGWSDVKTGLERMFLLGQLVTAGRDGFTRRYALPEQVLHSSVLDALANFEVDSACKKLLLQAAGALGVATAKDLEDYHRFKRGGVSNTGALVAELAEAGLLTPVKVAGWKDVAYLSAAAVAAMNAEGGSAGTNPTTIISPFDPLVWNRDRAMRLFDLDYKIEIYVPQEKRVYGYYSLPVLHNRRIVGRIDLKSDRQAGILRVQSAWAEPGMNDKQIASAGSSIARHLVEVQKWQGLNAIHVEPVGTLASALVGAKAD
jgi:uncharacterized protein YcaQ